MWEKISIQVARGFLSGRERKSNIKCDSEHNFISFRRERDSIGNLVAKTMICRDKKLLSIESFQYIYKQFVVVMDGTPVWTCHTRGSCSFVGEAHTEIVIVCVLQASVL